MYTQQVTETLAHYGPKYQFRLLYFTCTLPDFGRAILPRLNSEMFDQSHYKQLVTLIRSYWDKYGQLPNTDNLHLMLQTQQLMGPVDKELVEETLGHFQTFRAQLADGRQHNDSQQVVEYAWTFVQDREMRQLRQEFDVMTATRSYGQLPSLMRRMQDAMQLGIKEDLPVSPLQVTPDVWISRYPKAVPMGIEEIDRILPGGLPPGHLGLILGGQGIGKSSILTLIADAGWQKGYNVLHVVFDENNVKLNVMPKYHAKWSGIPVEEMKYHLPEMEATIARVQQERAGKGSVSIKRFESEHTTVRVLEQWILAYEESYGIYFDEIVMDYIDEVKPEGRYQTGAAAEVEVVGAFHSMLVRLDRPGWTATQGTKESNEKRLLYQTDCGGSVAKLKKAQVIITIGADQQQKHDNQMNIVLLKSNISKCGHIWEDCYFDRDTLKFKMGQQNGYVPEDIVRDNYEEGQYRSEYGTGAVEVPKPALPAPKPREAWAMPAVPAEQPVLSENVWKKSMPASTFESEPPIYTTSLPPVQQPEPTGETGSLISSLADALEAA
jgi:hypothetical protein